MYSALNAKYRCYYSCQILINLEFSAQSLEKYSNMKFYKNPFRRSRFVACVQTDGRTDRRTDRQMDRQTDGRTDGQTDRHNEATSRF
jgi:hypothetical protein